MSIIHSGRARLALLGLIGVSIFTRPSPAQRTALAPQAIGQIVDEALGPLIPADEKMSRVRAAQRGIYLDLPRTIAAFRDSGAPPVSLADLRLRTLVRAGSDSLIEGCDGSNPCARLGWG